MIQQLINKILQNKIDYQKIKSESKILIYDDENDQFDINVIIGCRGRKEFLPIVVSSFKSAINNSDYKVIITIVEHSEQPEHEEFCIKNHINYIHTKGNVVDQYSRSFAYNFGFLCGIKAKYYIMHDLDILVKENFFQELKENLSYTQSDCLQTYGNRRVLYMNQEITQEVLNGSTIYNSLNENSNNVSLPMFNGQVALGSKGGSILVSHDLFRIVGGFDPEIFWGYAAEDQFFWHKMELMYPINYADNPPIDMFHMWHPPSFMTNPLLYEMENDWIIFKNSTSTEKKELLKLKKGLLTL